MLWSQAGHASTDARALGRLSGSPPRLQAAGCGGDPCGGRRSAANGIDLDVRSTGDAGAPLLLFLHGFPEHADSWAEVMPAFAGSYHVVAPNQRGYAGSSKPEGVAAYAIKHLVRDMLALADQLSPDRPFEWWGTIGEARWPMPWRLRRRGGWAGWPSSTGCIRGRSRGR